jgi:hypothetical protein
MSTDNSWNLFPAFCPQEPILGSTNAPSTRPLDPVQVEYVQGTICDESKSNKPWDAFLDRSLSDVGRAVSSRSSPRADCVPSDALVGNSIPES